MSGSRRPRPAPTSIRFTEPEKAHLRARANGIPLGTFVKSVVLSDGPLPRAKRGRRPIKDPDALSQLLGLLGRSHLANNLNQLAKAANFGSLPVTDETEGELRQACADVAEMRSLLMRALGFKSALEARARLTDAFSHHSRGPRL
jgi:hypothetical protein